MLLDKTWDVDVGRSRSFSSTLEGVLEREAVTGTAKTLLVDLLGVVAGPRVVQFITAFVGA